MNSRLSSSSPFLLLLLPFSWLLVIIKFPPCSSFDFFRSCSNRFSCGKITGVEYPFWGDGRLEDCGHPDLHLTCDGSHTKIEIKDVKYKVLDIDQNAQILNISRDDLFDGLCSSKFPYTTFDPDDLFEYAPDTQQVTILYDCPLSPSTPFVPPGPPFSVPSPVPGPASAPASAPLDCPSGSDYKSAFIITGPPAATPCKLTVSVGILRSYVNGDIMGNLSKMEEAVRKGFGVKYKVDTGPCRECTDSGGACANNFFNNQSECYCPGNPSPLGERKCPPPPPPPPTGQTVKTGNSGPISVGAGVAIGGAGLLLIVVGFYIFFLLQRRKKKRAMLAKSKDLPTPPSSKSLPTTSINFSQSIPSYPSSKSDLERGNLEKGSTYFGVQVFSYTELEEATDNFNPSRELGEGGFGTVYYGNLSDGRVVAVKRLYENNFKRVEQFMNEVEILTRLQHKNLVKLYGCTSRRSRELLLVYEYIPNGTVADHLHGKRSSSGLLSWPVRMNIAIETAEALAYLHKSDTIHRDVKTNNILLDNNFCVKVADFGLSRLFPNDVTHVSTAPQGTPGYVDPEYYQCYQLTDKSDVYSFGVVLAELVSSLQAVDTNRHRHDINLANMVVSKIQNHSFSELVDPGLGFETNEAIRRMTTAVSELAFRCLQQERDMRPSMDEVVKVLKAIKNEEFELEKAEVVDIVTDEIGLLKNLPPPLSPDSVMPDKWVSSSTTPSSF